ncbi:1,6-anhydro-N-acetylmuramyl-L-alanine amidase AmpD [Suttonella sp. R2A3]|uniref:1,6-anhydro-N-acetylmuramyl-L-alanine amidase AmpD n=1 Tax=Suttonella sp. R2A3 TaxID=2908648 RepID=UPI001F30D491|nr:1,6-anhydro-N-acetylmuramyl-L-alanine amidase AmpD [Suttonella sp. R2A3]UJF24085.1 1,6-anhydro-N-acetylmuramyl-L-alanine amidase AmpD [Suttonella sp. R2A3]
MNTPWFIKDNGWLSGVTHCPSPHYDVRPQDAVINTLVIHNISLPPKVFGQNYVDALFLGTLSEHRGEDPFIDSIMDLRVSAHFLITRDGAVTQYVASVDRAWHAGVSEFAGQTGCNDFSVGVELNGADDIPYTLRQYQALVRLTLALMQRHPHITRERITTHAHIAPGRKTDPGPAFNEAVFFRMLDQAIYFESAAYRS